MSNPAGKPIEDPGRYQRLPYSGFAWHPQCAGPGGSAPFAGRRN